MPNLSEPRNASAESPPRLERIGALGVNLAPVIAPAILFAGTWFAGERGMDALEFSYVLGLWGCLGSALVLMINAPLLLRRRQTLGLAYFDLAISAPSSTRLLLAEIALLVLPALLGGVTSSVAVLVFDNELALQLGVFGGVVAACYALDVGAWGRSEGRSFGDRLAGARVVRLPKRVGGRLWADVLLLFPPVAVTLSYVELRGVAVGGICSAALMAMLVALCHSRK
jgi:hypothetical protein